MDIALGQDNRAEYHFSIPAALTAGECRAGARRLSALEAEF